jgi:hypothetical protein
MCKEMLVIQVNKVVDPKRIIRKRRAEEEERDKGSLTQKRTALKGWTMDKELIFDSIQSSLCH